MAQYKFFATRCTNIFYKGPKLFPRLYPEKVGLEGRQSIYVRTLARRDTFAFTFNRALCKVNGFAALTAGVRPIKFIRKYLFFFTAFGTFAGDYLEIFKICIPGTMLGR
jgi:hypothetical protein